MNARGALVQGVLWFSVCAAIGACKRDDTGTDSDTDQGEPAPRADIHGRVFADLCSGLPGASVTSDDSEGAAMVSNAAGDFLLESAPATTALRVDADGYVPTLTATRDFSSSPAEAAAVPAVLALWYYAKAGFIWPEDNGTVVLGVLGDGEMPVEGVTVALSNLDGTAEIATENRRQVVGTLDDPTFTLDPATSETGTSIFFDVPPGEYRAVARRDDVVIEELLVRVAPGSVTLDVFHGVGLVGAVPTRISGVVTGQAPYPFAHAEYPLDGAVVTATSESGAEAVGSSSSDGTYAVDLAVGRQLVDVTWAATDHKTVRGPRFCAAGDAPGTDAWLRDQVQWEWVLIYILGSEPLDPATGEIAVVVTRASGAGVPYAAVWLDPPSASPFYGYDFASGECPVIPELPDICSPADDGCPDGYAGYPSTSGAVCLPFGSADCDLQAPVCPEGTYCTRSILQTGPTGWEILGHYCYPQPDLLSETLDGGGVYFANVPPGIYSVGGTTPWGALPARSVRVSAGVLTTVALDAP